MQTLATLTGQLSRGSDLSYIIKNAQLTGTGVEILGDVTLEPDYKLRQIDLSNMSVSSLIAGAVKLTPDRIAGRLDVQLDASFLDVSPWTEDLFAERQSNLDVPLTLRGQVANLVLDQAYLVSDAQLYFSHTGEVIETARLEALSDGELLKLELSTTENKKRQLTVNVPDASKAVSAFMGLDNTSGGQLEIVADLPAAGEDGAYIGSADMRDFKLKEAPALAQLLSVLGDIFVQEKDGGLFALTYTVSGPFEKTQIAINPLSALTPGFLRGIFKRDRSEADEAMRDAIEDVQPKAGETP